jgi:4-hydroxy-4-methyl-2-oxoglutarate aldolase
MRSSIRSKAKPAVSNPKATDREWRGDEELFRLVREELYTPVVGDILDALGHYHQFLPQPVQPLRESMVVVGRAMPVLMMDVHGPQKKPFGLLTEALDDLRPGEVYVAGGGDMRCAYWGELLTATARTRGAAGAVVDGFHRDTPKVLEQNWPVFSRGRYAQDSSVRTAVANFRCPVEIGGVWIEPGDLVFGDLDGVVIVPRAVEVEVVTRALEKARGEKVVRQAIEGGMSATAAFKKFGIL